MTVRAGILGTGFMARVHAQAVASSGNTVVGVVGSSWESSTRFAQGLPAGRGLADLDELLALEPDVVHVCTPNALHREQAERILAAGVSVIVEKPLATTAADAAAVVGRRHLARVAAVPFIYRYYPLVREIRERIRRAPKNRLWLLHGSYLQDWLAGVTDTNWRVDPATGGASRAFGDIGVHWCDLMEFVTGQRIVSLSATTGNAFTRAGGAAQNATEDGAIVSFTTDAGAIGSLVVSQASAGRGNRLWFSFDGPDESYEFDQERPETVWVGSRSESRLLQRDPAKAAAAPPGATPLPVGHPQGYQQCFNDFVLDAYRAVQGGESPDLPTVMDGLRASLLTEAVLESAASGATVPVPSVWSYLAEREALQSGASAAG